MQARWFAGALLGLALASVAGATGVQPAVGHRAPDFTLRNPEGKPVQLSRILGEKAVLLNFWATWLPGGDAGDGAGLSGLQGAGAGDPCGQHRRWH